jgi:hypothetical protein
MVAFPKADVGKHRAERRGRCKAELQPKRLLFVIRIILFMEPNQYVTSIPLRLALLWRGGPGDRVQSCLQECIGFDTVRP